MANIRRILLSVFGLLFTVLVIGPLGSVIYENYYSRPSPELVTLAAKFWPWLLTATIAIAIVNIWAVWDKRRRRLKSEQQSYEQAFAIVKPIEELAPEDLGFEQLSIGAVGDPHFRPFYNLYINRKAIPVANLQADHPEPALTEADLASVLKDGRGLVIVGQPLDGKSRSLYEIVKSVGGFTVVTPHKDKPVPSDDLFAVLKGKRVMLLVEDLNDYVGATVDMSEFCRKLTQHAQNWSVAATCRDGPELLVVREAAGLGLRRFYENISLKVSLVQPSVEDKERLAQAIGRPWMSELSGLYPTLGSITMAQPLEAMRDRFQLLTNLQKDTLRACKLLVAGGVIPFTYSRLQAVVEMIFLRETHDLRDCLDELASQAFLRRPVHQGSFMGEPAYIMAAVDYIDGRRPSDDFVELEHVLESLGDTGGLISLAVTYSLSLELNEEARNILDRVLGIDPLNTIAWYNKGVMLSTAGKFDEGINAFDECLRLRPDDEGAWVARGWAFHRQGRHEKEIQSYDEALRLNPNHVDAWINKGLALGHLGRRKEELDALQNAID